MSDRPQVNRISRLGIEIGETKAALRRVMMGMEARAERGLPPLPRQTQLFDRLSAILHAERDDDGREVDP